MIDFDSTVNAALGEVYSQQVLFKPVDGLWQTVNGIFERHHELVLDEVARSEMRGHGHSTTAPVLTVRLSEFSGMPLQDAEVEVDGVRFHVYDVQPDGHGMADLVLRELV